MPPPEPRSSTVSPSVQLGDGGRVAAAERGELRGVGQRRPVVVAIERDAEQPRASEVVAIAGAHRAADSACGGRCAAAA